MFIGRKLHVTTAGSNPKATHLRQQFFEEDHAVLEAQPHQGPTKRLSQIRRVNLKYGDGLDGST